MKVAIDAYHALFPSGGIARYTKGLIHAMTNMASDDDFILFYNRFREQGKAWRPKAPNTSIRELRFPRRAIQKAWEMLDWPPIERFCGSVDLFHGLHFVLPPALKARRVLTVHDLTYLKFPHYFADRKLNEQGYRKELPHALNRADAVITVSRKTRDDLIEIMGFPEERIHIVHEGVEPRFFLPQEAEKAALIRKHHGLDRPYLVFLVGTPEPRKNLLRTALAARMAAPHHPLVLIGPRKALQRELGHQSDSTAIVLTGVVPEDHLPAILAGAQISLYPSLYEGFGLPVLESMASGAPVVASDRGSLSEVAGSAALLVDPEDTEALSDAITAVLENGALRERMREEGRRRAEQFTWEKAAVETLSIYRALL